MEKEKDFLISISFFFIDNTNAFDSVYNKKKTKKKTKKNNCRKFLMRWEYQTATPVP